MNILDGGTTANDSDDSEINFFAIFFFRTMNNRYLDRPLAYATNSYIMLDSAFEMSDTSFLLHFRMEKESFQLLVNEVRTIMNLFKEEVHMEIFIVRRHLSRTNF